MEVDKDTLILQLQEQLQQLKQENEDLKQQLSQHNDNGKENNNNSKKRKTSTPKKKKLPIEENEETGEKEAETATKSKTRKRQSDTPNTPKNTKKKKLSDEATGEKKAEQQENATTKKMTQKMTQEEYDEFLLTIKEGRLVRKGPWKGMSKGTLHACTDTECAREWSPAPSQCLADDYYCPSCVLHHRNNVDRFSEPRLKWTANVPNTFYVFSMIDSNQNNSRLIKFGRTQHEDAWKRYPAKERRDYSMQLILKLRGRLEIMTKIENWWKKEAEERSLFCRFSDASFHGVTECLSIGDDIMNELIEASKKMASKDKNK